ncbi:retrotransposon protein, putative, Ty3-gypsy subclass [Panicum miliaceum]|uniref:Retrotransposon protein, putative, Ty3-gypsy subclass n=1 Tax=Panicum miliaceum TaxID=4540 RepID=A0A3L6TP72_PANMI|nr:retrotransposon protein, putative, Ty3-gypsy subclass [Panicum miliaceum]
MAESDEYSNRHRNERPEQISEDEHTADAANESAQDHEARRLRNRKRAMRRRDANDRRARIQRDLDAEFAAAQDAGFSTPAANIAGITAVLASNPDPQVQTTVCMAQRALLQINQQNPMPSVSWGRGEGEGESQVSRTPGGHPRRQVAPSNSQQGSRGPQGSEPATHAPHPKESVHNYRRLELEKLPMGDLRDKINMGRYARSIINNRRKERVGAEGNTTRDDNDRFPAFSSCFNNYEYPEGFKPIGITKYDGKQSPQQWIRCYSTAIEVTGGTNTTKVVYFPMALETAPLTWLESLTKNSIDSWEQLRNVFIDNFQGAIARAGT